MYTNFQALSHIWSFEPYFVLNSLDYDAFPYRDACTKKFSSSLTETETRSLTCIGKIADYVHINKINFRNVWPPLLLASRVDWQNKEIVVGKVKKKKQENCQKSQIRMNEKKLLAISPQERKIRRTVEPNVNSLEGRRTEVEPKRKYSSIKSKLTLTVIYRDTNYQTEQI